VELLPDLTARLVWFTVTSGWLAWVVGGDAVRLARPPAVHPHIDATVQSTDAASADELADRYLQ